MKRLCSVFAILLVLAAFFLVSCQVEETPPVTDPVGGDVTPEPDAPGGDTTPDIPSTIEGVTLASETVTYDTKTHSLQVVGNVPSGVICTYTYNGQAVNGVTDVGTYAVVATLSGENYTTLRLEATLTIQAKAIEGVTLTGETITYDTKTHSLQIVGNVPSGVVCTYTYNGQAVNGVTDVGTYAVVATLSGENYTTLRLEATLTIRSEIDQLYTYSFGDKIYFQNPLDNNYLYVIDSAGNLSKVPGYEKAQFFTANGDTLYYTSKGLLSSSIKQIDATGSVSSYLPQNGEYLANDGTYLYFAKNSLIDTNDTNGIYRVKFSESGDDAEIIKLVSGKASYLTVWDGYLYYAAGASKGALSRILLGGGDPEVLVEDDVSNVIVKNGVLYFNRHTLTGNAIHKYVISTNSLIKMTTDSGDNLTIVGNYLYYVNSDFLTGTIFGDGIYRVALSAEGSLPGTRILQADVSSLTSSGDYLYYYFVNDRHFYRYSILTGTTEDLMQSYTVPEETAGLQSYAYAKEYGGEIWFINARDGGAIWKYNPATGMRYKLLSDSCSAFYFHGDYLYYSTYVLTNYALWRTPITGGEAEKISSSRCDEILFDGEWMYYVDNGVTYNTLRRLKPDSTEKDKEDETLYGSLLSSVHCLSLRLHGGKVFFCTKPKTSEKGDLMYYDTATGKTVTINNTSAILFTADDTALYYYNAKDGSLCAYTFATGAVSTITTGVTAQSIAVLNGSIYWIDTTDGSAGLYTVKCDGSGKECIKTGTFSGVFSVSGGIVYYEMQTTLEQDYPVTTGTGYFYYLPTGATTATTVV